MPMVFVLLYTLILSDGTTLTTHRDARTLNAYKRIHSIDHCKDLAKKQELRLSAAIIGSSRITSVTVQCYKSRRVPSTKPGKSKKLQK